MFLTNSSNTLSLASSFFTISLSLLASIGIVWNLPVSNSSTSALKLAKSIQFANFDASIPVAFVAKLDKSNSTFTFPPKGLSFGKDSLTYTISCFTNPNVKRTILAFPFNL